MQLPIFNRSYSTYLIVFLLLCIFTMPSHAKTSAPKLPQKYQQWLDMVDYIITGSERGTFLKLTNDRDREIFINLFWNLRDPSPGTQKNQFKEEHIRRFQHAQKYYKYGTPRPGWQTDMGRIYIILGQPDGTSRYPMDSVVYPVEIWSYYGQKRPGLPASFNIVFFKPHGMGEFQLYDPSVNTPSEILKRSKETQEQKVDLMDVQANYEILLQEHPELARASLSLLPDETSYDFTPSLRSRQLLNNVIRYPKRKINDSYATGFLKYKGKVEVDYSINYVQSKHHIAVYSDPDTGIDFIHFALKPSKLSAQAGEDGQTFFFNIMMSVSLYKGETPVFEYRKRFPYSGKKDQVLKNFYNSVLISDLFPAPPGRYRLSVLLQNQVSKEFTFFDTSVTVPPRKQVKPVISGLSLAKDVKEVHRQVYVPFKYRELEVTPEPALEFGTKETVNAVFNVERGNHRKAIKGLIEVNHLTDQNKYAKQYPFTIAADANLNVKVLSFRKPLEPMPAGYYNFNLSLIGEDGTLLDEKKSRFTVSFRPHIPGTTYLFKTVAAGNKFLYYHILGIQHMRLNNPGEARKYLETALSLRPGYGRLVKDYCGLLLQMNLPGKALEIAEQLKNSEKDRFHYLAIKGKAFYQKAMYAEAVTHLARANRIYDSDASVLNALGFSYLKQGNKEEARKVFNASLKLDSKQKNILKILSGL